MAESGRPVAIRDGDFDTPIPEIEVSGDSGFHEQLLIS